MNVVLDTVILVANLSESDEEYLQDRFTFNSYNKSFKKSIRSVNPFFVLNIQIRNTYAKRHYNAMLIMQNETLHNMPDSLQEILFQFDWIPKRFDFAFDSHYGFNSHSILKYHANLKLEGKKGWSGYYIGSLHSKHRMNIYDRNEKEKARNTGVIHNLPTRFEIRIRPPKLSEQPSIHNLDYDWILEAMQKYIVVENNDSLKLRSIHKRKIKLLRRKPHDKDDYNNKWRAFSRDQKKLYKSKMIKERIPFETIFMENVGSLFSWIPSRNEVASVENISDEELFQLFG